MNKKIEEYYNQRLDYGINKLRKKKINALVKDRVKAGGQNILDLGCAAGYISADWRDNNYIIGLDISQKSVDQAKHLLSQAYLLDLETDTWPPQVTDKKFDIILCAEIIEHLFNPQDFLNKLKDLLQPQGSIILTTPNFLVWNNRLRMLLGNYGQKEIFNDSSHIRLFSYNSLKVLLDKLNFEVVKEDNLWYPNYLDKFSNFLPANLFVYQTILKLKLK